MKKLIISAMLLIIGALASARDVESLPERIYFNTDRDCYVAGDALWLSAFCVDASGSGLSTFSSIAYVEMHSAAGLAATCKIALKEGRGGGRLIIPNTVPTGNYKLIAYTACNVNDPTYDYASNARTVSIFNPFTKDRVADGVKIVPEDEYKGESPSYSSDGISIRTPGNAVHGGTASLTLTNGTSEPVSISLSVAAEQGMMKPHNAGIADFIGKCSVHGTSVSTGVRTPEYEGEVIDARIMGVNPARISEISGLNAYLSAPSEKSTVYMSVADQEGRLKFFTNNIYGQKDLVLEIAQPDSTLNAHVELVSPFVDPELEAPEQLPLSISLKDRIENMAVSMQIEKKFASDTLYDYLDIREDPLYMVKTIRYHLDDYTRFPTIEEDIIEFIAPLKVIRTGRGRKEIGVRLEDSVGQYYYSDSPALVMLDGTPIFDVAKIFAYDPLLVEDVVIYPKPFFLGDKFVNGYVDFVTYKKNLPAMTFNDNVRIVNFQGPEMPMAYTCARVNENANYPDYRQLVYWHPLLTIDAGQSVTVECSMPSYGGTFIVRAEGLTESGSAVSADASFMAK